jgi:enoyl-CoA hydratase/carnithine racemase
MQPLSARRDEALLWLTLDTPGSDVNVFDLRAARALEEALCTLESDVEAVVLTSSKPGSFVNGVGLMMAGAVKAPGDVARLTEPVRRAYRALRDVRVPTIAAIRGNCFGCGVELALQCRYRVAIDDGPTRFYMTEIADYLFVPCFGATQDLPRIVGLDAAIRLVVAGEEWSARDAVRGGLVDRLVPAQGSDEAIRALALDARAGLWRTSRVVGLDPEITRRARTTLTSLPDPQRFVSARALDLLERGGAGAGAYEEEIVAAEETVACPASKAAQGFFFVRQIAATRERKASARRVSSLVLAGLPALAEALRRVAPLDLPIASAPAARFDETRLLLASTDGPGVDVVLSTGLRPPPRGTRARAWAPFLRSGIRFVEIDGGSRPEAASALASVLQRAGLETATSFPGASFVSQRVAAALLDPLDRYVAAGGRVGMALAAVIDLGIARSVRGLATAFDREPLRPCASDGAHRPRAIDPRISAALAASLVATALDVLAVREVAHPATLDLVARHVIDFPLAERSLTTYATRARARALLDRHGELEPLVEPWVLTRLETHAQGGRDVWS